MNKSGQSRGYILDSVLKKVSNSFNKKSGEWRLSSHDCYLAHEVFERITFQFRALGLINILPDEEYELTPYGDRTFTELVAVRKGQGRLFPIPIPK